MGFQEEDPAFRHLFLYFGIFTSAGVFPLGLGSGISHPPVHKCALPLLVLSSTFSSLYFFLSFTFDSLSLSYSSCEGSEDARNSAYDSRFYFSSSYTPFGPFCEKGMTMDFATARLEEQEDDAQVMQAVGTMWISTERKGHCSA